MDQDSLIGEFKQLNQWIDFNYQIKEKELTKLR